MRSFPHHTSLIGVLAATALTAASAAAEAPHSNLPPMAMPAMPSPTELVAQQTARTMQAVADMHTRLAAIVPMAPRDDAIGKFANEFAAHWQGAVASFAENQAEMIDAMILDLNKHHEEQIESFLSTEPMSQAPSLFSDPGFGLSTDATNTPVINAGFFGL